MRPRDKIKYGAFTVPVQCDERDLEIAFSGAGHGAGHGPEYLPTGMSQTLFNLFLTSE